MAIPTFLLEISHKNNKKDTLWTSLKEKKKIFIKYKNENLNVSFFNINGNKICILGNPILEGRIDNEQFSKIYVQKRENLNWLKTINGEFVVFFIPKNKGFLEVTNSRFNFPTIWYYFTKNIFLISFSFTDLVLLLKKYNLLELNEASFFEVLMFRRNFGSKTLEKNTKMIMPATRLIYDGKKIKQIKYWKPNFKNKINISLNEASDQLIDLLSNSLKSKMSDKKRYGLFLSGGMDTRLILACLKKNNLDFCTFTFNTLYNREVKIAKMAASIVNAPHYFIQNEKNHYAETLDEAVHATGSMYQPLCLFYGHSKFVKKYADICLHGHGFDFLFQGMYLPRTKIKLFNKSLHALIPKKVEKNIVNFFIENASYKVKGGNILDFLNNNSSSYFFENLKNQLKSLREEADTCCNKKVDIYEYITFSNLPRHYSFCDNLSMNSIIEIRTPSFDNYIYDFYQSLPWEYRFDSKIQRLALKKMNPKLASLNSANTLMPIKYSSYQKTLTQILNFLKKQIFKKKEYKNEIFERMGLPISYLIKNDWNEYIKEILNKERISQLKFLDFEKIKKYLNQKIENKNLEYDQFIMMLISIDRFLKLVKK